MRRNKPNCLQNNPGVLQGEINWYNEQNLPWITTEQEIATMLNIFSTRFYNAYILDELHNGTFLMFTK